MTLIGRLTVAMSDGVGKKFSQSCHRQNPELGLSSAERESSPSGTIRHEILRSCRLTIYPRKRVVSFRDDPSRNLEILPTDDLSTQRLSGKPRMGGRKRLKVRSCVKYASV